MSSRRTLIGFALVAVLATAGCGEAGVFDGAGDRVEHFVEGEQTTTSVVVAVAAGTGDEGLIRATDALWFNDDIDPQAEGDSEEVIASVRDRRLNSRFIQASRGEIAAALPALLFPERIPSDVRWITSQLVYDSATGSLDVDTSAAFGLWAEEPYRSDTARLGVLRVGRAPIDAPAVRSDIVPILVPDGISLGWTESGMRYELFCRSVVSEELCTEVALSTIPLADLVP